MVADPETRRLQEQAIEAIRLADLLRLRELLLEAEARLAAATQRECPTCARLIRPCNMARHRVACDRELRLVTEIANAPSPTASAPKERSS